MLIFHQSNRLEMLAGSLAGIIEGERLSDPFARETVIVLSRPMQHWLSLQLADAQGIWANADFPFPKHFFNGLFRANLDLETVDVSPYDADVLTWVIMHILDSRLTDTQFRELKTYLQHDDTGLKRYQLSRRIAELFDQYMIYRPDMIRSWNEGKAGTNAGWQAALWRAVAGQQGAHHRAALAQAFLEKIAASDARPAGLPERVSLFGICALPPVYVRLFEALGQFVPIHVFTLNPCREYWSGTEADNTFLASMGHLGREFMDLILDTEGCEEKTYFEEPDGTHLLASVQSEILDFRAPDGRTLAEGDDSVQVHCCHSPMREVEVLHDRLLDLFERRPDLEPRDVIVMAPDIESYAPYVQAVFGREEGDERRIPFAIADQSARYASPVLNAFFGILDLPLGRFTSVEVLRILEVDAVHRKRGLTGGDLEAVRRWLSDTNVHWGIDAGHRGDMGLPDRPENTWRWALDRMLLGYAMPGRGREIFEGILSYDEIEGGSARVLGVLAEFVEELGATVRDLGRARAVREWAGALNRIVDRFIAVVPDTQGQVIELKNAIADLERHADEAGFDGALDLKVVKAALAGLAEGGNERPFLTYGVNFSAFVPLRSIPFRVVCLLGLNNSAFPRMDHPLRFDLIRSARRPGDRSRRDDDRYLFLEALISARDVLYMSYVGRSLRDNSEVPPSVLVSELLDYVAHDDDSLRSRLVVEHPLQPFSPAYFRTDDEADPGLFSFSEEFCRAGISLANDRKESPGYLFSSPIDPPEEREWTTLTIEDLMSFFVCPARFMLARRMGIRLANEGPELEETERFSLDALQVYKAEDSLIELYLAHTPPDEAERLMRADGFLPHGMPGTIEFRGVSDEAQGFLSRVIEARSCGLLDPLETDEEIAGLRLVGRLQDVCRDHLLRYRCGSLKAKDTVRAWIAHVVLNVCRPDGYPSTTLLIGRGPRERYALGPPENARDILEGLVALYREGLRAPLPFFPETSLAYVQPAHRPKDPIYAAIKTWERSGAEARWYGQGERYKGHEGEYYALAYGAAAAGEILDERFKSIAEQFYKPLLDVMEQVS